MSCSYIVYWMDNGSPQCAATTDMGEALQLTKTARDRAAAGEPVSHVCFASEDTDNVGLSGVEAPPADYDWRKRRP